MPDTHPLQLSDLRPGVSFRQYQLLEQIGVGGQGMVWSALDQEKDRIVAVKLNEVLDTDQQKADDRIFERQAGQLVTLRHPCILPMYDYGLSDQVRYMVTPYIPGGSLEERILDGPLPIEQVLQFAAKIASALDYLHGQNVVHRDLKPSNILMDYARNLYVADFGLARVLSLSTQAMHTGRGTPPYASPEQHSMAEMTPRSDLYSFGIMLYEMFTRQLPWNGEKVLGIQQLHSPSEIPDPVEIDPTLPADLVTVLRRLTAASPATRPQTAGEAMQGIYAVFRVPPIQGELLQNAPGDITQADYNTEHLVQNSLTRWEPQGGTVVLSLTKFAYVELQEKRDSDKPISPDMQRFMLHTALTFGYDDNLWWSRVNSPKERLTVAGQLISKDNPAITARVVKHLVNDAEIRRIKFSMPEKITNALLELITETKEPALKKQILHFLRVFTPAPSNWRTQAFGDIGDRVLAQLAFEESDLGNEAARLIGHLRSESAARIVLRFPDEERRAAVLTIIQQTAGNLPGFIPANVRTGVFYEWALQRLTAQPLALIFAYALIATGAAFGAGLQVYLTYRLPNFMDLERLSVSVERGVFLGVGLGLGILLIKLLVEYFPEINVFLRTGIATITGGLILSATVFFYDALFLQMLPGGLLILAGCLLLAAGFALAGLVHSRILKVPITFVTLVVALAGTWFTHASLAATPGAISPIFFYEYTWPAAEVFGTILVVALPMAILPSLAKFTSIE